MSNEERIAVLELQYSTMKRIVLGVACVISLNFAICALIIVGYFVSTTNVPDLIQAKKFEVVNGDGKTVASIGADAEGGVLSIGNNEGEEVAEIAATVDGDGGIVTIDSNGEITSEIP